MSDYLSQTMVIYSVVISTVVFIVAGLFIRSIFMDDKDKSDDHKD